MKTPIRILMLEDCQGDVGLIQHEINKAGIKFVSHVVDNKADFENALVEFHPDVVLSDHSLPQFSSVEAFEIFKKLKDFTPFILITGTVSEEFAAASIKLGIDDYILKNNLLRLPSAILNALKTKKNEFEKQKAVEKLRKSEIQIRNFATHLNTVLEEERARIAREIHDELGQQLTGIKLGIAILKKQHQLEKKVETKLYEISTEIDVTIQTLRKIATELRPAILDTLGLIPAIDWISREFEKKTNIACTLNCNLNEEKFEKKISTTVFRICQETLTNIAKHSGAQAAAIQIKKDNRHLVLEITDNGKGIEANKLNNQLSMGIIGMYERAKIIGADLKITSNGNSGTQVKLSINV